MAGPQPHLRTLVEAVVVKVRQPDAEPDLRPPRRRPSPRPGRWAGGAALALLALYAGSRLTAVGWSFDVRLQLVLLHSAPAVTELARHLLALVNPLTVSAVTGGLAAATWRRAGRRAGVEVVLGAGVALALAESGKALLPTASHPQGGGLGLAGTFPSGHLAVTSALVLAALAVARPRLLAWVAGPLVVVVAAVAVVVVGWHRPSDAVGGVLAAVLAHHGVRAVGRDTAVPPTGSAAVRSSEDVQAR